MNRFGKLLFGFVSILPILITALFFGVAVSVFQGYGEDLIRVLILYLLEHQAVLVLLNPIMLLLSYGPVILFIIHAAKNLNLGDRKAVWIVFMLLCGGFALPIYWFMFIWQERYYEA